MTKIDAVELRRLIESGADLSNYDYSHITDMSYLLKNSKITKMPVIDLSNVILCKGMFEGCIYLEYIPPLNIIKAQNISHMFLDCIALIIAPDLYSYNANFLNDLFSGCRNLTNIGKLYTSKAISITYMFYNCNNLEYIPKLNLPSAKNTWSVFYNCYKLKVNFSDFMLEDHDLFVSMFINQSDLLKSFKNTELIQLLLKFDCLNSFELKALNSIKNTKTPSLLINKIDNLLDDFIPF